jgi:threonylcarbamoyladenosine tRNA methylthiotransferase MtaB
LDVTYLHVFTYSERANTPAIDMEGAVPIQERRERNEMLRILSEKKKLAFYHKFCKDNHQVLWEAKNWNGYMFGFSENYIKYAQPYNENLINKLTSVQSLEVVNTEEELFLKVSM